MENITELTKYYSGKYPFLINKDYRKKCLRNIYKRFIEKNENGIVDAIVTSSSIEMFMNADNIAVEDISPQMEEAFKLSYPNLNIDDLNEYSPESLQGIINCWKGKLFEVIVRDRLNSGEVVGELRLLEGQVAVLAENANQPGWDIQILDKNNLVVEELQLKATDSLEYIKNALENYTGIGIVTTDNVEINELNGVTKSGITNDELESLVSEPLQSLMDSNLENIVESYIIPGIPFFLIAISETGAVLLGKKEKKIALKQGVKRAVKSMLSMMAGALAFTVTGGIGAFVTSFITRISIDAGDKNIVKGNYVSGKNENLRNVFSKVFYRD